MSTERLRRAATVLRERVKSAVDANGASSWRADGLHWNHVRGTVHVVVCNGIAVADAPCEESAEYIATMHPGVGLALADWLQSVVDRHDAITDTFAPGSRAGQIIANENVTGWAEAVAVARQILEVSP